VVFNVCELCTSSATSKKPFLLRLLYIARDLRSKEVFRALRQYSRGQLLDVGGWDFFLTAKRKNIPFEHWTTIEPSDELVPEIHDPKYTFVKGDGCAMTFAANTFDTVLCLQVVEHVMDPIDMVKEIGRVLKPGGYAVFLTPQTASMHMVPNHYYNFTRFWSAEVMPRAGLEIVELVPLGGLWSSVASHLVYFFLQSARLCKTSTTDCKRNILFYLLYPFMVLWAIINIPVCMILSLGDLSEEANNHLVVVRKS
jgi:SAM-dependent methyltransferase